MFLRLIPFIIFIHCLVITKSNELVTQETEQIATWKQIADSLKSDNPDSSFALAKLILSNTQSPYDRAFAKYLSGAYFYKNHHYDTAYVLLAQVVDSLGETSAKGTALLFIGRIFSSQSNFKYSEEYHQKAVKVFDRVGSPNDRVSAINGIGIAHYNQGNYTLALDYYSRARSLAMDEGVDEQLVRILSNIVGVYTILNENEKAMELAEEAYQISLRGTNIVDKKTAIKAKGYVFAKMKMLDSAIFYNEMVVELANKTNDYFNVHLPLLERGDLLLAKKDTLGALNQYKAAVKLLEERDFDNYIDWIKLQMAEIYLAQNQLDSAIIYGKETLEFSLKNDIKWSIQKSSELLAKLYASKSPKASIQYYTTALAYKDSIYNEKSEKEFANQRVKLETIEKSKEIERLQSAAEIARLKRVSLIRSVALSFVALVGILIAISLYFQNRHRIQKLKEASLNRELERNKRDLHVQTMNMIRLNNDMQELEESLKEIKKSHGGNDREVKRMLTKLQMSKSLEKEWDSFNMTFSSIHHGFISRLRERNAELTINEIRLCTLLKLNLSNAEVSSILNIESKSVRMSKYRLKKRLGLEEEVEITSFLQSI